MRNYLLHLDSNYNIMKNILLPLLSIFLITGCSNDDGTRHDPQGEPEMYFPPNNSQIWETKSPASLGWNEDAYL